MVFLRLLTNTNRGIIAEFIIANTFGIADGIKDEWLSYDLTSKDGIKIEVKTYRKTPAFPSLQV